MKTEQQIIDILQALLALTKAQSRLMESDGMEGLDENLAAREKYLERLASIPDRAERFAQSAAIRALVAEIHTLQERNAVRLAQSMQYLEGQMKRANDGMTAMRAYDNIRFDLGSSFNAMH